MQLIGVPDKAEKDEIVKSVMSLKNAEIEEGYTMDVVVSRQVKRFAIMLFDQIFSYTIWFQIR